MTDKKDQNSESSDFIVFADETPETESRPGRQNPWKILVSDDEQGVHDITRLVLKNFEFDDRKLEIISAFTGEETKRLIQEHPDIAIILQDVVMETQDAGLEVVRFIREELENKFVRIILRTGQPGKAPEREVITKYDINDYKEKTDLTAQKLFTVVTASLRAFRDLQTIEKSKRGLEQIIISSGQLHAARRIKTFSEGVLTQLTSLLNLDGGSLFFQLSSFAVSHQEDQFKIIAATGDYEEYVEKDVSDSLTPEIVKLLYKALAEKSSIFTDDVFIGYYQTEYKAINLLILIGCSRLSNLDKDLIRVFSSNVGVAFDNISLNQEIVDTQKEIIETLGGIVETRSKETANHVSRVSEYAYLLAIKAGLSESEASLLRLSAPMHDVGKIGISDAILKKPDELSPDEFELIKSHTSIGYDILSKSKRKILQAAAIVALQHHEFWDGSGYPNGLKGEDIHIFARIIGLVDVYDAVSCNRIYKEAWDTEQINEFILKQKGHQFDPKLVDIFLENIGEFENIKEMYPD